MARPKGEEKKGGRVKGTPNKSTVDTRKLFQQLVENNLENLQDDFDHLKPAERVKYTLEMAKFCLPTLKSVDYQGKIEVTKRPKIEFD